MESQGLLTWWEDRSDRSLARRLEVLQLTDVFMSLDIEDIGQLVTLRSVLDWITNRASGGDGGILTLPRPDLLWPLMARAVHAPKLNTILITVWTHPQH